MNPNSPPVNELSIGSVWQRKINLSDLSKSAFTVNHITRGIFHHLQIIAGLIVVEMENNRYYGEKKTELKTKYQMTIQVENLIRGEYNPYTRKSSKPYSYINSTD